MEMNQGPGYDIGVLVHVIGILLLAGTLMIQVAGSLLLRRTKTIDQIKLITGLLRRLPLFIGIAAGLILVSGIFLSYLHISEGGAVGWLVVAIIVFLAMAAYGSINGKRFDNQLGAALAHSDGKLTTDVKRQTLDHHQIGHAIVSGCMFLDIVYLMIYQPGWIISIAVTVGLILVGSVISVLTNKEVTAWQQ